MRREDQERFGPTRAAMKDGREVILRPLKLHDGEALAEFYAAVPREDYRFYCPHPLTRQRALDNAGAAGSPFAVVIVAADADGGRIVGYGWYRWKDERLRASTMGICIRRGYQSGGLGRALIGRLLEIAGSVGPAFMQLTVQLANPRAIALYRSMGFEVIAEQMREPKEEFGAEREYQMDAPLPSIRSGGWRPRYDLLRNHLAAGAAASGPRIPSICDSVIHRIASPITPLGGRTLMS